MRMMTWLGACLLLLVLVLPMPSRAEEGSRTEQGAASLPLAPTDWLVIEPVDFRARRPFNPDMVFEQHLLDPKSGPPRSEDLVTGERGVTVGWKKEEINEQGHLEGRIGYAYTRVQMPQAQIALARMPGAAMAYVNGVPVVGDIYSHGFGGLPVALKKGANEVFVRGVRKGFQFILEPPPAPVFVASWSRTLPDLPAGQALASQAGLFLVNATDKPIRGVRIEIPGNAWLQPASSPESVTLAPLSILQVSLALRTKPSAVVPPQTGPIAFPLLVRAHDGALLQKDSLSLTVRPVKEAFVRTFRSEIDGSVQKYGLLAPQSGKRAALQGLVLSLHGASVKVRGQTRSYSAKPDFWIAAPTNRRPFGFDWQDWGRLDAYEVLADALRVSGVKRERVYLTGHSMGGHGTWHLAANDPDGFAAIAPSAGWISFDTYPGKRRLGTRTKLWHHADGPSLTLSLLDNLVQLPTYIVHGTKDDDVPVSQASQMEIYLARAGRKPETHYQEGAGHWWNGKAAKGTDCVDWPGIFELFRGHTIAHNPPKLRFTTWNPAIDATHYWLTVEQQLEYGKPSTVNAQVNPKTGEVQVYADNVARVLIDRPAPAGVVKIGGTRLPPASPKAGRRWFSIDAQGTWHEEARGGANPRLHQPQKTPRFSGPFRQVWRHEFSLVYGTGGSPEENRACLGQARADAQVWYYRGNGRARLIADRDLPVGAALPSGNLILYGNEQTNAAFGLLPKTCPLRVLRGQIQLRGEAFLGSDLGTCFLYPAADGRRMIGVMGSTGVSGARLGSTLMTFLSGVGLPDYVIYGPGILTDGDGGVLRAGWFDRFWKLQPQKLK